MGELWGCACEAPCVRDASHRTIFQKRQRNSKSAYRFFARFLRLGLTRRAHSSSRSSAVICSRSSSWRRFIPAMPLVWLPAPKAGTWPLRASASSCFACIADWRWAAAASARSRTGSEA